MTEKSNQPMFKSRVGAVTATVWSNTIKKNDGTSFEKKSVSLERSYKDKDGEFKTSNSYDTADVPKAILALQKAYEVCTIKQNSTD